MFKGSSLCHSSLLIRVTLTHLGFSITLLPAVGQAAGAPARPGSDRGARPAAEQRASAQTVCQPGQCHRALDPDQDGGQCEQSQKSNDHIISSE